MNNFWKSLPKPFTVLAPMENVTDHVFREIVATCLPNPDVFFTEFTNTDALTSAGYDKTIPRFSFSKKQKPIVAQIWGTRPENFLASAKIAVKLGFDGIDINMGCPDRAVVKSGACSALINNPQLASEIITATRKGANNLPISVKTRIGFNKIVTTEWVTFLLEQKIDALTIHARTAKEKSDVPARWDEIKIGVDIKNKISPQTIIIGNGDVLSMNDVQKKYKETGVDGVMIGRGIFKNPWVFDKTEKNHTTDEYINILVKHINLYQKFYNGERHFDVMKKFFKMYINNFKNAADLRMKLMETKTVDEAIFILSRVVS